MATARAFQPRTAPVTQPVSCSWRELKASVSILGILEAAGKLEQLRHSGRRLVGPCPIHGGDNPSAFSVGPGRGLWYCFTRCRTGGDSVALAWHLCGRSWPRAATWLRELAGQSVIADAPFLVAPPSTPEGRLPARPFRPFLRQLRLDAFHPFFARLGLQPRTVASFEAGAWYGPGFLERTVAVRLRDLQGNPLGYAGRRLDANDVARYGKWKWPPGYPKGHLLYNWHRARTCLQDGLVVVEGAWSVMKLAQAGFHNVVALGGTLLTNTQAELLSNAAQVVLMLDGDEAGRQATLRYLKQSIHPRLQSLTLPAGSDPADLDPANLRVLLTPLFESSETTY